MARLLWFQIDHEPQNQYVNCLSDFESVHWTYVRNDERAVFGFGHTHTQQNTVAAVADRRQHDNTAVGCRHYGVSNLPAVQRADSKSMRNTYVCVNVHCFSKREGRQTRANMAGHSNT